MTRRSRNAASVAPFNPQATNNLAVYFGHSVGNGGASISDLCTETSIDIIIIGFVRGFNGRDQPPSVDFGTRCKFPDGLAAPCPSFAAQVQACQTTYHKKIFISVGGSSNSIVFNGADDARECAEVIWNTFGADFSVPGWRPFGNTVVDGIDIGEWSIAKQTIRI